jgi:hypothetical protein
MIMLADLRLCTLLEKSAQDLNVNDIDDERLAHLYFSEGWGEFSGDDPDERTTHGVTFEFFAATVDGSADILDAAAFQAAFPGANTCQFVEDLERRFN